MIITFSKNAWEDYTSWFTENKNMLKKTTAGFRTFFESLSGQGTLHFMAPFLPNGSKIVENKKA